MGDYKMQIAQTIITIIAFSATKLISKRLINRAGARFNYHAGRMAITNKIVNILLLVILIIILLSVWRVDQSQLLIFFSTIATILGVAFFAQWSLISNITSTLIIFFNHPIRIGDSLTIMDKDYPIKGELNDIGIFFITIKTTENEIITIPSNLFMQKMIKRKEVGQISGKNS